MNSKALVLGLAVMIGGVALLSLYKQRFEAQASGGEMMNIVTAAQDLPLGQVLSRDMIVFRSVPSKYVEERHIQAGEADQVVGIRIRTEVRAGESILWTDLATTSEQRRDLSSLVRQGMRAVTIEADVTSAFGGLLRPGDRVDVLLTASKEGDARKVTLPLLQNLLVLAVGRDTGVAGVEFGQNQRFRSRNQVTLGVTIAQAQALTYASERGRLTLILRNPDDTTVLEDLPETTGKDILQAEERARKLSKPIVPKEGGPKLPENVDGKNDK